MRYDIPIQFTFRLFFTVPGAGSDLILTQADLELVDSSDQQGQKILTYRGTLAESKARVRVVVRVQPRDTETLARLEVEAVDGLTLTRVQFPCLECSNVESSDCLLVAAPWGDCIPNPARAIADFCAWQNGQPPRKGRLQFIRSGDNEVFYAYPGILAMQYAVLYNQADSLYLACYGMGDESRAFAAGAPGQGRLALSFNHYPFLAAGRWESPPCAIASLPGGWHAAADLYAAHMGAQFTSPDLPEWLQAGFHGWVQIMMLDERLEPLCRYRDLPDIYQRVEAAGMNVLHVAGWNEPYFDALYPDFDLNPALGTAEELKAALSAIKARGGRVILYTNGRLIDPNSRFYQQGGKDVVCLNEDGLPYLEQYGNQVIFNVACPDCEAYIAHFTAVIERLIKEYGAHAVQIDQISCTQGYFCYSPAHGHPTPAANFLPGVERLLRRVRLAHQQLDPEFFTWIEGCNERFGQYYDIEQGHGEAGSNWNLGVLLPEMFHYTFPERMVTGLSGTLQQLCHTFVQGKPFDIFFESLQDAEFRAMLLEFLSLRRAYPEYFLRGVFRDCVGVETTGGVRAFRLDRRDSMGSLINFWLPGAGLQHPCRTWVRNPRPGTAIQPVFPADLRIDGGGEWQELSWRGPVATTILPIADPGASRSS